MVRERVEKNRVTLKMNRYTEEKLHLCIYSRSSGFGHTVYGKQLTFITKHIFVFYVTLTYIFIAKNMLVNLDANSDHLVQILLRILLSLCNGFYHLNTEI